MPTILYEDKVYISVEEVINYLSGLKIDMETQRELCLQDIKNMRELHPAILKLGNNLTNLDYDFIRDKLNYCLEDLKHHLSKRRVK